jgi:hypothetical protein
MGFTEILTIVLVVLKALGYIHIAWWLCFLPEIIAVGLYLLTGAAGAGLSIFTWKKIRK